MSSKSFKVSFSLDEDDVKYFRALFQRAKQVSRSQDPDQVLQAAQELVESVRKQKKTPGFVLEAIQTLEDLTEIVRDEDYAASKRVRSQIQAGLAYFANPQDLIPDDIPVLGFLDDAIMIRLLEDEFKHELWAFRKFRKFRSGAEQRPWTVVASKRLPGRLEAMRAKVRADAEKRRKAELEKGGGWSLF
jgi:uncharacterized membrane protein YkvA (DUF1232 family)